MNKANRQAPVQPGERVNQYEILEELGRGGMGVVFKARDTNLDRDVALKCPWPEHLEEPKFLERFLRECKASAGISHPNVVPVLEVFESNGIPWLALGLVDGMSLGANINGPLEVKQLLKYAEDIAKGLDAAHRARILHRDLTPNNVLIDQDGRALLMDFGLARFLLEPSTPDDMTQPMSLTTEGVVMGTLQYMSPEQALGKPLDVRSDIFSFGAVLYEMCTGSPPFSAHERGQILDAVIHHEPAPISRFTYEVPAELEWIVRKCLAKQPEERYQGTQDLLVDLKSLRKQTELGTSTGSGSHVGTQSSLPSFGQTQAPAQPKKSPLIWILPLLAVAAALAFWFLRPQSSPMPTRYTPSAVTSLQGLEGDPAVSPDGSRVAFTASVDGGNKEIFVVSVQGGQAFQLTNHPANDYQPSWYPDGSFIAFTSRRSGNPSIWKIDPQGGDPIQLTDQGEEPSISPDGSTLAFTYPATIPECRVAILPLDKPGTPEILTDDGDGLWYHRQPSWSPDGTKIAYATQANLWSYDLNKRDAAQLTEDGVVDAWPVWSPTGDRIYFSTYRENTLAIWSASPDNGEVQRLTPGSGPESHPSISKDGSALAYTTEAVNYEIRLHHLPTGTVSTISSPEDDLHPALAPDGSFLVFVSARVAKREAIWRQNLEDGEPVGDPIKLTDSPALASTPDVSADGKWIAYYTIFEGQRDVFVISSDGSTPRQITEHGKDDVQPVWSPDGSTLAFVSDRTGNDQLWLVDMKEGERVSEPRQITDGYPKYAPQWSGDGSTLAFVHETESTVHTINLTTKEIQTLPFEAPVHRVRWDSSSQGFFVCKNWNETNLEVRRLSSSGEELAGGPEISFDNLTQVPSFATTQDSKVIAHGFGVIRGDIWVLKSNEGPF